ncbi:MAG: flagellar assembly protein FliX [Alphaproteobacteria bacterium]|nr:flagellar assembly protein FliX [Alphaproteobacteria bacterium]
MINKVDGPGGVRGTQPVRKAGKTEKTGGANFSSHLDEASSAHGVGGASGIGGISALIGLQEVDDATQRESKGKKRAQALLDEMDDLRLALACGTLTRAQLLKLSAAIQSEKVKADDPGLNQILDDVDLRARVELAKYGF